MEPNQSMTHHVATESSLHTTKRQHNTLKERIKRSMKMVGEPTRRRESLLEAASALASLAANSDTTSSGAVQTQATTQKMVASAIKQSTSKANDLHEKMLIAAAADDAPCTFPQKLMAVLDNDQLSDIISWLPHGKGFIILQKKRFAADVMPLYFKHSKFTSFTRKLNRWGFTRVSRGPESGAYYHKYFQKGNHILCMQMYCQSKSNSNKNSSPTESPSTLTPVPSPKVEAAKDPTSPGSKITAEMSALRVESSPLDIKDDNGPSFEATLSRQQELLREVLHKDQQEQHSKKRMHEGLEQDAQQMPLAAVYQPSRRSRNGPERNTAIPQVEVTSILPPLPLSLASSSGQQQNLSFRSSLSSSGQLHNQSLQSSPAAAWSLQGLTASEATLRDSWNAEPGPLPMMTSPRTSRLSRKKHHLQDVDWSKISNYSIQERKPDHEKVDQFRLCQSCLPSSQDSAMVTRTTLMSTPAYNATRSGYKGNALGVDTSSSSNHRHVIKTALNALQVSNDRAYLTWLMQREHEKAKGNAAIQAQMNQLAVHKRQLENQKRQLEMYNRIKTAHVERRSADQTQGQSPFVDKTRVEQLQQQMKNLSSNPCNSGTFVQINRQSAHPDSPPKGKFVRRASAA